MEASPDIRFIKVYTMGRKLFIPVTDEMLYEHPEWITAPLCPYQVDNPCLHWMAVVEREPRNSDSGKSVRLDQTNYLSWLNSWSKPQTRLSRA